MKRKSWILCTLLIAAIAFGLGWRVMPKAMTVFRGLAAGTVSSGEPAGTEPREDLYTPRSTAAFEDTVLSDDSLIYYFYKDYCPYCKTLDPLIAGLPDTITLPDGKVSRVKLVCLNKVEEASAEIISAYYEAYHVPEERQFVPAVVIGSRYLFTGTEIISRLMNALTAGEGTETPVLNGSGRQP